MTVGTREWRSENLRRPPRSRAPEPLEGEEGDDAHGYRHYRRAEYQRDSQIAQAENGVNLVVYPAEQNRVARLAVV